MEKTVLQQLTELPSLPFPALKDRWRSLYGTEPPAYKREHLVRRLAYRIQELAYGGLPDATKAELEQIAEADERQPRKAGPAKKKATQALIQGTRLIREWDGRRHEVTVADGGFDYNGKRYRSLSAIAKIITGGHWSGPYFFGLNRGKQEAAQ